MKKYFFEWYYFDIHSDNGYDIVFTLHSKPFMSQFKVAIFDYFIYKDNKVLLHHYSSLPQTEIEFDPRLGNILVRGKTMLSREGDTIRLITGDATISLDLLFESQIAHFSPVDVYFPLPEGHSFSWHILSPLNKVTGKVNWNGRQLDLSGIGYHDANSGDINPRQVLRGWTWAKYFVDDILYIYGEVEARQFPLKRVFVKADSSGCVWDENPGYQEDAALQRIGSSLADLNFTVQKEQLIDDLYFYVALLPRSLSYIGKAREIAAHLSLTTAILKPFKRWLTNCRYQRLRQIGVTGGGNKATSFREIMFFDGN